MRSSVPSLFLAQYFWPSFSGSYKRPDDADGLYHSTAIIGDATSMPSLFVWFTALVLAIMFGLLDFLVQTV